MPDPKDYNFPDGYLIHLRTQRTAIVADVYRRLGNESDMGIEEGDVVHMVNVGSITLKYHDTQSLEDFPDILIADITKKLRGKKGNWDKPLKK